MLQKIYFIKEPNVSVRVNALKVIEIPEEFLFSRSDCPQINTENATSTSLRQDRLNFLRWQYWVAGLNVPTPKWPLFWLDGENGLQVKRGSRNQISIPHFKSTVDSGWAVTGVLGREGKAAKHI